ncbi:MAG: hypothetical protein QF464_15890 [Myxococcota bacterium]|nr:hypothetical protein [Myxococcota bacterium]
MYWDPICFTWCTHEGCGVEEVAAPTVAGVCDHCGQSGGQVVVFHATEAPRLDMEICALPPSCTARGDYAGLHHENHIILWPSHLMCLDLTHLNAWIRMRAWRAAWNGEHSMLLMNQVELPGWETLAAEEWRMGKRRHTTDYRHHVYEGEHDRFEVNRWGVAPWTEDGASGLTFVVGLDFRFDDGSSRGDTASSAVHEFSLEIRLPGLALVNQDHTHDYR